MVLSRPLALGLSSLFITLASISAHADVLFEGYSKVLLSGVHVGYAIQRYEFDSKKQEFTTTSYLRTNPAGGNITESLKARSTASLKPISFQYTGLAGGSGKTIDATFKDDEMTAIVRDNGKQQSIKRKIPKGTFLSSFLAYVMLQGKEGIKPGTKYGYQAIAEEDAGIYTGEAFIKEEETVAGISTFRVLNTFKGANFVSNVTHKGEIIATKSPVQQIATELTGSMQDATAGMPVNSNSLTVLFGSIPKGTENAVARKSSSGDGKPVPVKGVTETKVTKDKSVLEVSEDAPQPPAAGTASSQKQKTLQATPAPSANNAKKEGVPGGEGLTLKGGAPSAPPQEKAK